MPLQAFERPPPDTKGASHVSPYNPAQRVSRFAAAQTIRQPKDLTSACLGRPPRRTWATRARTRPWPTPPGSWRRRRRASGSRARLRITKVGKRKRRRRGTPRRAARVLGDRLRHHAVALDERLDAVERLQTFCVGDNTHLRDFQRCGATSETTTTLKWLSSSWRPWLSFMTSRTVGAKLFVSASVMRSWRGPAAFIAKLRTPPSAKMGHHRARSIEEELVSPTLCLAPPMRVSFGPAAFPRQGRLRRACASPWSRQPRRLLRLGRCRSPPLGSLARSVGRSAPLLPCQAWRT